MALRQYRPDQIPTEEYIPKEKQAPYKAYQARESSLPRINELLFFVNIVVFSILTVLATYVYLSLNIPAFLSFCLAIPSGFIGMQLLKYSSNKIFKRIFS
ncbi:DUF3270 family protein [Streptococcus suis]|uniref:DUF3270 family protein n=1 Tax=Streptococcus suis TaxID=1307 RepID=UPI000CF41BD2|nr:DUF3270 family protein [Streptococcus suis]